MRFQAILTALFYFILLIVHIQISFDFSPPFPTEWEKELGNAIVLTVQWSLVLPCPHLGCGMDTVMSPQWPRVSLYHLVTLTSHYVGSSQGIQADEHMKN